MTVVYSRTHANPGVWLAPGRTPMLAQPRETLVYGTYIPGADTTGVLPGTLLTPWEANVDGYISINEPGLYVGYEFWGEVRVNVEDVVLLNCALRGRNPDTQTGESTIYGAVKAYGANHKHFEMYDCTIDPLPWVTQRGASGLSPRSTGIHGGNLKMFRCEVTNVQDGWNFVGHDPENWLTQETVVVANWIHGMYFQNDWWGPSDGRTHSDVFQFNTGRNVRIEHNMLGGHRDMVGYRTWPGGYNSGDDAWNAVFMVKQEVSMEERYLLKNILINHNWIAGGTVGVNHPFITARPNDFSTMAFTNNIFFPRGEGWASSATGPDTYTSSNGWITLVGNSITAEYSGNTWLDGTPATIRRAVDL